MTPDVKKLYKEALNNQEFNDELQKADPQGYYKPSAFSTNAVKHIYASAYYGWLVGKGKFNKQNYTN